ncbi:PREDICTED: CDK5 regulatory subunit-associated protein 2 isoform X4 [Chinchilla lanigera]|uniref:CDK5 regulatory subunit-associated protein 2 isoform X4 n=1 Tax=Chinchilla lanigera TaxID=34839 RepID=UPI00038ED830|nr:PREDICTED: CDK5 regulatory subunit-associated protein 2 isoform X4 [Chinchilla lanigera]
MTPPDFRRKKRRERWRQLRFEFQRRRHNLHKSWVAGGGDLEGRAGRNSRGKTSGAAVTDTNTTIAFVSMMDSVLEEDVTLPGTFSGCSGLVPPFLDDQDGISTSAGLGNGMLPTAPEEKVSPTRARNMKDFENQITELKKENFNLKLRIYFLEERMQQEFDGPTEHIYKTNIELKVEVESLKRELHEKEQLLIKASKAVESLAEAGGSEIQRVKDDARKKVQQVEDRLTKRILLLEGDVKAAQAELEKAFAGTETEKALRLSLESKLSEMKKMLAGDLDTALALEEKDRLIEELKLSLKSKEALIQCLKEQESQMASPDENVSSGELRGLSAAWREEKERDAEAAQMEHQKERREFEEKIQALQEDLREKEREIATEKKNSLKRDKAIQGLTMALKSKEKEVEELNCEIKELSTALAKAREAPQKTQTLKFHGSEDHDAALAEKEALLAELRSENLTKISENHRLQRNIKKVTQDLSDLHQEKESLERDLEEAQREGSKGARTIHDLRNEVEKLRNEVNEREKAMENLLSESNKKLHNQEQVIKHLTESANQKDLLLQKFNEKDLEAIQRNRYLMAAEDPKFRSEGLITEKRSSQQSPGSKLIFLGEKQQSDYEELMQVLKKERDIYSHLVKSLQNSDSANNLQAELNAIFALRKQLERDVLSYRNLQKTLEEQISEIRRREEEPFSFYSDQTSYLSICLEEHNLFQGEHFSQEELKKKVSELIQLVKELYTDNQHLKKTIFDLSCMSFQGNGGADPIEQRELLPSKGNEDTVKVEEDDGTNFQGDQHLEPNNEILEDCAKGGSKNGYLKHTDSNSLDCDGANKDGCLGDQNLEGVKLLGLLAPFFNERALLSLESRNRPDLLIALHELLLEQLCLAEQVGPGEHLDGETEKTLKQMAIQLRDELGHLVQANSFTKPHGELKSAGAQLGKMGEVAKVELKDASVQTVPGESHLLKFECDGKREAWEEKPTDAMFGAEPENECRMPGQQATPFPCPSVANKGVKRSRLPILEKPSRPLGNTYHLPATQEVVVHLQEQILELQGELREFKTRNKQLHQKLILAEALTNERPAPDQMLLNVPTAQPLVGAAYQDSSGEQRRTEATPFSQRDKEGNSDHQQSSYMTRQNSVSMSIEQLPDSKVYPADNLSTLPACIENPEDLRDSISVSTHLSSKSQLSVKDNAIWTDESENIDTSSNAQYLKQKIHDLETELEVYQKFIFQLHKHSQCSEAIITVMCGTEGAQDGSNNLKGNTEEEEKTFSSLHQVRYVKHMKILCPLSSEMTDGRVLESLKEQLVEQEYELNKEQNLNMELFSDIHNLPNKFRDLSFSSYDSLVQSQARELSLQRQQIKVGHGICVVYRQHMDTMIAAFAELLQASDVDDCVATGFQEQLSQCAELLERLEKLFLSGKPAGMELTLHNEPIERMEANNLTYQPSLLESSEPSASHMLSDDEMSEKSSLSQDQKPDSETEKVEMAMNHFSQDLLMEHIQEIRTLRKRLEDSIKTNEKLRKQLERQGSEFDQGSANIFSYGSELHSSLTSEIHFLRKQNQELNMMLAKGSQDKQKENEKLRESISRKAASLEHLQQEYASVKGENERLQKEVSERQRHNQQLLQEVHSGRQELSRVQEEVKLKQQLLSQNDKLLQSLRVELKVYEKLDAEHTRRQQEARAEALGAGWKGQDPGSDLHGLLTEIQALRAQLERSIETNNTLRSKLEEQLAQGAKKAQEGALALSAQTLSVPEQSLRLDKYDGDKYSMANDNSFDLFDSTQPVTPNSVSEFPPFSENDVDSLSCDSNSLATTTSCMSHLVTGHRLWASKSGHHVLGLFTDYDALWKQICQVQRLLAEMDPQTHEAPSPSQELGTKGPDEAFPSKFVSGLSTARQILEEASRALKLLWRVSLPTDGQCPLHCGQISEMRAEITKLHKKLFEQEKKLQNTVKLLQQSKHQEKVIFDQLVITHRVLRKARGNLELRPRGAHPETSSPSRPGS